MGYLEQTFAPSTQKTYKTQRETYLSFCRAMGYTPVPASTAVLCRYAVMLARTLKYTTIKQYLNIVRLLHLEWNITNPLQQNHQLDSVLKGIRRALGDTPTRKLPVDPPLLIKILSHLDLSNVEEANVWAAALIMFFAMLRRSNVLTTRKSFNPAKHLKRGDITFHSWGAVLKLAWSKTIQFRQRTLRIPLPRIPNHPLCPVQAIFRAFQLTPNAPSDGPAFIIPCQDRFQPLTPTRFVDKIQDIIKVLGLDPSKFAGHSFRRGGATWAYSVGVPMDIIRIIGDWKSMAYTAYVQCSEPLMLKAITSMVEHFKPTSY